MFAAVVTVLVVILAYDQLLFRPLVAFAGRFRVELVASQQPERSWVADVFRRTRWLRPLLTGQARLFQRFALLRLQLPGRKAEAPPISAGSDRLLDVAYYLGVAALTAYAFWQIVAFVSHDLSWSEVGETVVLTLATMARVILLIVLATLFWVPVGVWIGLRPARRREGAAAGAVPRRLSRQRHLSRGGGDWCCTSHSTRTSG